jgi:hypothetical protein
MFDEKNNKCVKDESKNVMCKSCNCRWRPAGCQACGNPAYPECKDSCPMFDVD